MMSVFSFFVTFRRVVLFTVFFFFFNDTATTEIYTLSLHDALPIGGGLRAHGPHCTAVPTTDPPARSEEHTSELQSRPDLVCRLLLEKKKTDNTIFSHIKERKSKKTIPAYYSRE